MPPLASTRPSSAASRCSAASVATEPSLAPLYGPAVKLCAAAGWRVKWTRSPEYTRLLYCRAHEQAPRTLRGRRRHPLLERDTQEDGSGNGRCLLGMEGRSREWTVALRNGRCLCGSELGPAVALRSRLGQRALPSLRGQSHPYATSLSGWSVRSFGLPNTRDQLRSAHDHTHTHDERADESATTRLQPRFVSCIALFGSLGRHGAKPRATPRFAGGDCAPQLTGPQRGVWPEYIRFHTAARAKTPCRSAIPTKVACPGMGGALGNGWSAWGMDGPYREWAVVLGNGWCV
jgi:hypothetical protein